MQSITLRPGQSLETDRGVDLRGFFTVALSTGGDFVLDVPGLVAHRKGSRVMVRDFDAGVGVSNVLLRPSGFRYFGQGTMAYVTLTFVGDSRDRDIVMQFPGFDVSSLASFPLCTLSLVGGRVVVQVADQSVDVVLDERSTSVRSALRTSVGVDSLPLSERRDVTVVVDATASMAHSTSFEALEAMCAFACGVLSLTSQDRQVVLRTSSRAVAPVVAEGPADIASFPSRGLVFDQAGWSLSRGMFAPDEVVVIVSDDMPAGLVGHGGRMHLLSSRVPLSIPADAMSVTVFTPELVEAVQLGRIAALAGPARAMLNTLTGREH